MKTRTFSVWALALGALLFEPLRHAAPYMDDHLLIALGRHLDEPWLLLTRDSVGAYFFRPLVMFFWWVTATAFEDRAAAHYAINIAIHVANGVLLRQLLLRFGVGPSIAAWCGLAFIAHPAAFSAAAWLCIRFDLLATSFGLLAMVAAERYVRAPAPGAAATAIIGTLASILSKETGFAFAAVVALMLAWAPRGVPVAPMASRRNLVLAIAGLVAVGLALRLGLRPVPEASQGFLANLQTAARGLLVFARQLPDFTVVLQGSALAIVSWLAVPLVLLGAFAWKPVRILVGRPAGARLALIGMALLLLAAAAPAIIIGQVPIPAYAYERFEIGPLLSARFFYAPLAALLLVFAVVGDAMRLAQPPRVVNVVLGVLMALAVAGLASSSRAIGGPWAAHTQAHSGQYARAALAAITALPGLAPGCKVYLLQTPAAAHHFREMADTIVKHALPRGHAALRCFIQAEHAPWYHLLERQGLPADAHQPMEIIRIGGEPFEPLVLGNLAYFYLRVPARDAVVDDPAATFLAWRNDRFVEVTDDVRARRVRPAFFDNRPQR